MTRSITRTSVKLLVICLFFAKLSQGNAMNVTSLTDKPELAIDTLQAQIKELLPLKKKIESCQTYKEKLEMVRDLPQVERFFKNNPHFLQACQQLPVEHQYILMATLALNQGPVVFDGCDPAAVKPVIDMLYATERFYSYIGGLVGYHVKTLQLMSDQLAKKQEPETAKLMLPPVVDMRKQNPKLVQEGIHSIDSMAEIYVVGGAGDRLALVDEKTKMPLPVARLQFAGHTLLENLVRDLEAREYLAYKLTGRQHCTPIVLMTSHEKKNDEQIEALLDEREYFGRPKESIFRLLQPMTPVVAIDGNWAVSAPGQIIVKPGGHGVIWKLAEEYGAFDWLQKQKRSYMIVRQINNPLAGLDANLLTLAGYGSENKMGFGFESVPRLPNMSEGMNVLKETSHGSTISNIEYTEFAKAKASDPQFALIADSPDFPANTNILFADIDSIQEAVKILPVPGYLVNMKHPVETLREGKKVTLLGARLESTMQNIADAMTTAPGEPLETFVLLNDRAKTMSVTKKAYDGKSIQETPEGCFQDLMKENLSLLRNFCKFDVEENNTIFLYHPALGPLYSIIGQKVSKGSIKSGSEFVIEAADVQLNNLHIDGSLRILAEQVTGKKNSKTGCREFSNDVGRCILQNVQVKNAGINRAANNRYFTSQIERTESAQIVLLGNSECVAKDVVLTGNVDIVVQPGTRATLSQGVDGKVRVDVEPLKETVSLWRYTVDSADNVCLIK